MKVPQRIVVLAEYVSLARKDKKLPFLASNHEVIRLVLKDFDILYADVQAMKRRKKREGV